MTPVRIGIVGAGNISGIYLRNLARFRSTEVVAIADLDQERAQRVALEHHVATVLSPDELLAHPDVDLVLNLTIPAVHGAIARKAVQAGKHVYNEKPLATELAEAKALLTEAAAKGVLVGCAPDTFLGAGMQTARRALDAGMIGTPIGAQATFLATGPEPWHPNPATFYKPGAGPMLDMGPYYTTALINLLGGVRRTTGIARASFAERPVPLSNSGYYGERVASEPDQIRVETPTHLVGVMEFAQGAIAELTTSFDVHFGWPDSPIKIFGSEGTMHVPDPNEFSGTVKVRRSGQDDWEILPLNHGFEENSRGLGLLDMAHAIRTGAPHRASGALAVHALEIMLSFEKASNEGRHQIMESLVARPAAMGLDEYADEIEAAAV